MSINSIYRYISAVDSQRIRSVASKFNCTLEDAQRYLDLLEEGYSRYQAKLMAGLCDPDYSDQESEGK